MPRRRLPAGARARTRITSTVKTEIRALDVLEFLNHCGGEARVGEVAHSLGFPQSSASRLLVQLCDAGYLVYDRTRRTYRLSARSALLGANAMTRIFGSGEPFRMLEALRAFSESPVILTSRNQTRLVIIHIEKDENAEEPCFYVGRMSALVASASGRVILSTSQDTMIQSLVRRHNAETSRSEERVRPDMFLESVSRVRQDGYLIHPVEAAVRRMGRDCRCAASATCATSCCLARRGAHIVFPLCDSENGEVAAIVGIRDSIDRRHQPEFAADARAVIEKFVPSALAR